eukprot:835529-Pelagomonas_calceolata.AAC.1
MQAHLKYLLVHISSRLNNLLQPQQPPPPANTHTHACKRTSSICLCTSAPASAAAARAPGVGCGAAGLASEGSSSGPSRVLRSGPTATAARRSDT